MLENFFLKVLVGSLSCTQPQWVQGPTLVQVGQEKMLEGKLVSDCQGDGERGGGFSALKAQIERELRTAHINQGPDREVYKNVTGDLYNVTFVSGEENQEFYLTQDIHLASDLNTVLFFDAFSTDVDGYGDTAYLRRLDNELWVNSLGGGRYNARATMGVLVKKPGMVGDDKFLQMASEALIENYTKEREKRLTPLFRAL